MHCCMSTKSPCEKKQRKPANSDSTHDTYIFSMKSVISLHISKICLFLHILENLYMSVYPYKVVAPKIFI